jgi:hypothetical protein
MSRSIHYRDLEPHERRAAMMRAAGMSLAAIGQFLDCDYVTVAALLKRPRVARYMLALESTMVDAIDKSSVRDLNKAIEDSAHRAFEVEETVMERLFNREYDVRAQLGAAATAQDILDRAGKRAPAQQRIQVDYGIEPHALQAAVAALREHERVLDVTPRETTNGSARRITGYGGEPSSSHGSDDRESMGTEHDGPARDVDDT